jgi:hypothetical protein
VRRTALPVALLLALSATACGGTAATPAPAATSGARTGAPVITEAPAEPTPAATEAPASIAPGTIAYRVVNLTVAPVDAWVRTQGLVTAAPGVAGLAPGAVSDDLFPPEPGTVVILPAGEGDPTCVMDCAFLGESSTTFGEGDRRILVVTADGVTEYWERATAASIGATSNALIPADPARAILVTEAAAVTDGQFGLRIAVEGVDGCLPDTNGAAALVGGTLLGAFPVDPAGATITVHDSSDGSCADAPVGGPFPVSVTQGGRTFLLLWGAMGSMQGVAVPLP